MRKTFFVLVALLLASAFAFAEDNGTVADCVSEGETIPVIAEPPECCSGLTLIPPKEADLVGISGYCTANCGNGTCDEIESSLNCQADCPAGDSAVVEETDTDVGESIVEEEEPKPSIVRKPIARLHLVGNGLAISEADAFDFGSLRVVIGAVKVTATAEDATTEAYVAKRLGVMKLDGATYHLKDIAVSGEEISAVIYGPATDATAASAAIGEIKVKLFEKPGRDVWAGNMVLNAKAYNVYLLGVKRGFKLAEVTDKIGEECSESPEDAKCRGIVARCGEDPVQCRERAAAYCLNNPTDLGCLQLKKQYCLKNASDERCRDYLKNLCEENSTQAHCRVRTVNGEKVIGINSDAVSPVTAEKGETVKNLITSKVRERLNNVKNSIETVTAQARTGRQ